MKRLLLGLLTVLACLSFTGTDSAFADDGFTIDPVDPVMETDDKWAKFKGTIADPEGASVYAYVDGVLLTCDEYFGNEIDPPISDGGCWRIAGIEGSNWEFTIFESDCNRLGMTIIGKHEIRFVLTRFNGVRRVPVAEKVVNVEIVLASAKQEESVTSGKVDNTSKSAPTSSSELSTGRFEARSSLSELQTVANAFTNPGNIVAGIGLTVVLILLIGLPSTALDSTLSENYDRIFGRAGRVFARLKSRIKIPVIPNWGQVGIGIFLASLIASFVDPQFGFNAGSVRLLISIALAFVIEDVLGWFVISRVIKKTDSDLISRPKFRFGFLAIILVAVLLSRLSGFEPGLIFGMVLGVGFGATLALAKDARIKLIGMAWALIIGFVCWVLYSLLQGSDFFSVFFAETFSTVTVSALVALPITLLPISGMDGATIFKWNRWAWAGCLFVSLAIFFWILIPMPFSWGEVGMPLGAWVSVLVAYCVLATGLWAWFRFRTPGVALEDSQEERSVEKV